MGMRRFLLLNSLLLLSSLIIFTACGKKEEKPQDNLQAAIKAALKEKTPENYLNLSVRYYEAGQYEKCIETSQEALKLKPDFALAYNNICSAYNEMKMWDKGIEACQQALKIDPELHIAKNNLNYAVTAKKSNK